MEINKGAILGFFGSWAFGIGYLVIRDSRTRQIEDGPCDNAPTIRALESAFGDVITGNHTAHGPGAIGKELYYAMDDTGLLLAGFVPVHQAPAEREEKYQDQLHAKAQK